MARTPEWLYYGEQGMQVKWRGWLDGSGIESVDLVRLSREGTGIVVRVTLRGEYLSDGQNESSRVLRMAIAAALAWEHSSPVGLVLDLTDLEYFGGDTLLAWEYLLDGMQAADSFAPRVAFLCSDRNSRHVQTLLDEAGDETSMQVFRTEDEALSFVMTGG